MPTEKLIYEPVVLSIPISYPELTDPLDYRASEGARILAFLSQIVGLDPTFPLFLCSRAHGVLPGPFSSPICDGRFGIPAGGNV